MPARRGKVKVEDDFAIALSSNTFFDFFFFFSQATFEDGTESRRFNQERGKEAQCMESYR